MKVLVYGSTGSQGSAVVESLLAKGHVPYMLTRHPEKTAPFVARGAQIAIGDLNDALSLITASEGMDAVALMIPFSYPDPTQAVATIKTAIDAAKAAGVKLIVYNTSGTVPARRLGNPMMDMRQDVIDYLVQSGIPYIVIAPTAYLENLLGPWTRPELAAKNTLAYPIQEHGAVGWIAAVDVGAFVVSALEHPELAPAHFSVSGAENLTGKQLADQFSRGLDRAVTFREMPLAEFGGIMDSLFGPGAGDGAVRAYEFIRQNPDVVPMWVDMQPVLQKLPITLTSPEAWVRQFAVLFTAPADQPVI